MASPAGPVILVDDSSDDLLLTEQLLRKAGVTNPILTAPNGEEAIALFGEFATAKRQGTLPAFVLCDVRMPGMDGFDVLKWVRSQPRLGEVYFAMHTGGNVPNDRVRACNLGANEFLPKFPTAAEIRRIATEALDVQGRAGHTVTRRPNASPSSLS